MHLYNYIYIYVCILQKIINKANLNKKQQTNQILASNYYINVYKFKNIYNDCLTCEWVNWMMFEASQRNVTHGN